MIFNFSKKPLRMSFKYCLVIRTIAGTVDNYFNNFWHFMKYLNFSIFLLLLLLLILATMTYNQVQSFQVNAYVNHYVDIEV